MADALARIEMIEGTNRIGRTGRRSLHLQRRLAGQDGHGWCRGQFKLLLHYDGGVVEGPHDFRSRGRCRNQEDEQ